MFIPTRVILHCSATPDYRWEDGDFDRIRLRDIDKWHRQRGFSQCGYHFVITRGGVIEAGRPSTIMGAHCLGENTDSLGVCWVGTNYPTMMQIRELANLYVLIKKTHGITYHQWWGHYEFNQYKTCPGFSADLVRSLLAWYDVSVLHSDPK
jgi:hypothetical protein